VPLVSSAIAEGELVSSPWTNPVSRLDVNGDAVIDVSDGFALLGIKNNPAFVDGNGQLILPKPNSANFVDISGDGYYLDDDVQHLNAFFDYQPGDPGVFLVSPRPQDRDLVTSESGGTEIFTLSLISPPTADVTVTITSSNPAEGTVSTNALTFRPEDGITSQRVIITGVADGIDDGDQAYTIITGDAVSDDPRYDGLVIADVPVTNVNEAVALMFDFGDLPDSFATTLASDGPRHTIGATTLGASVTQESDSIPSATADTDADDDGVIQLSSLVASPTSATVGSFLVNSSSDAMLDAWIDFNGDGSFDHATEHINGMTSVDLTAGDNVLSVEIPAGSSPEQVAARFRVSSSGGLMPTGTAADGEVEDYFFELLDGGSDFAAMVSLASDNIDLNQVTLDIDGSDLVATADSTELIRVPANAMTAMTLHGNDVDNVFSIANIDAVFSGTLVIDGRSGFDQVDFIGTDQTIDLTDDDEISIQGVESIAVTGSGANTLSISPAETIAMSDNTDTLKLAYDAEDQVNFVGDWQVQPPEIVAGTYQHIVTSGDARLEITNAFAHQNPLNPLDVNRIGGATVLDPLLVINAIARGDSGVVTVPTAVEDIPSFYLDVRADNEITVLDALRIINFLALGNTGGQGEQAIGLASLDTKPVAADGLPTANVEPIHQTRTLAIATLRHRGVEPPIAGANVSGPRADTANIMRSPSRADGGTTEAIERRPFQRFAIHHPITLIRDSR
tara:strand:- start:5183 stop:7387 length:2205 start_codon:yes stop_codon:yes gene_type:complete